MAEIRSFPGHHSHSYTPAGGIEQEEEWILLENNENKALI